MAKRQSARQKNPAAYKQAWDYITRKGLSNAETGRRLQQLGYPVSDYWVKQASRQIRGNTFKPGVMHSSNAVIHRTTRYQYVADFDLYCGGEYHRTLSVSYGAQTRENYAAVKAELTRITQDIVQNAIRYNEENLRRRSDSGTEDCENPSMGAIKNVRGYYAARS